MRYLFDTDNRMLYEISDDVENSDLGSLPVKSDSPYKIIYAGDVVDGQLQFSDIVELVTPYVAKDTYWLEEGKFYFKHEFKGLLVLEDSHCDVDAYFTFVQGDGNRIEFDTAYIWDAKNIDHTEQVKQVIERMYETGNFDTTDYDLYFS